MPVTAKQSLTAGAGYISPIKIHNRNATVMALPGSGGTVEIQYTISPLTEVDAGTATYLDWPDGAVSSNTSDALIAPITAIRARAVTANGAVEVAQ